MTNWMPFFQGEEKTRNFAPSSIAVILGISPILSGAPKRQTSRPPLTGSALKPSLQSVRHPPQCAIVPLQYPLPGDPPGYTSEESTARRYT